MFVSPSDKHRLGLTYTCALTQLHRCTAVVHMCIQANIYERQASAIIAMAMCRILSKAEIDGYATCTCVRACAHEMQCHTPQHNTCSPENTPGPGPMDAPSMHMHVRAHICMTSHPHTGMYIYRHAHRHACRHGRKARKTVDLWLGSIP